MSKVSEVMRRGLDGEVLKAHAAGASIREIAERFGLTFSSVQRFLNAALGPNHGESLRVRPKEIVKIATAIVDGKLGEHLKMAEDNIDRARQIGDDAQLYSWCLLYHRALELAYRRTGAFKRAELEAEIPEAAAVPTVGWSSSQIADIIFEGLEGETEEVRQRVLSRVLEWARTPSIEGKEQTEVKHERSEATAGA